MRIEIEGFKGADIACELGRCNLVTGPNGSGKSTIADALRFLVLGYVPAMGKRPSDTAALVRCDRASVRLTTDGGQLYCSRTIERRRGKWSVTANRADIREQFGPDDLSIAECLDIRQLLAATPNQRAARMQDLLAASASDAGPIEDTVGGYLMQRLTGMDRKPDDWKALQSALRPGEKDVLRRRWPGIRATLQDGGLAECIKTVNAIKRATTTAARDKQKALALTPAVDAPEVDLDKLRAERSEIERELGAIHERERIEEVRRKQLIKYGADVDDAKRALALATAALADAPTEDEIAALNKEVKACREKCEADEVPDPQIAALEERVAEIDAKIEALPDVFIPTLAAEKQEAKDADHQLALASPWLRVGEIAAEINEVTGSVDVGVAVDASPFASNVWPLTKQLKKLCIEQGGDVDALREAVKNAKQQLAAAQTYVDAEERKRAENKKKVAALEVDRDKIADEIARRRTMLDTARIRRRTEFDKAVDWLNAAEDLRGESTAAVKHATRELKAVEQRVADLSADIQDCPTDSEDLAARLTEITAQIDAATIAARALEDRARIETEMREYAISKRVEEALEWALQRAREESVTESAGALTDIVSRFLGAAGCEEVPYFRAAKGKCEIGWTRGGLDVSIAALSGGEHVLFAAAVTAATIILRGAAQRVLLVEAAECDAPMLDRLCAGIGCVAECLTTALVMTPHEVSARDGWATINMPQCAA